MDVGFFFWPFTPELTRNMAAAAERLGWDMIGVADTPGNAMDPWMAAAGAAADGVFVNDGLDAASLKASAAHVARGAASAGRSPDDLEIWRIACLDCHDDREVARRKVAAILAFVSSYVIGSGDLAARGVKLRGSVRTVTKHQASQA